MNNTLIVASWLLLKLQEEGVITEFIGNKAKRKLLETIEAYRAVKEEETVA